jgi:hypothetical protein
VRLSYEKLNNKILVNNIVYISRNKNSNVIVNL